MRAFQKNLGVAASVLGAFSLVPAILLLNQRLELVRTHWGVFDVQIGNVRVSNDTATLILGAGGIYFGVLLVRRS